MESLMNPQLPLCVTINYNWYDMQDALDKMSTEVGTRFTRNLVRLGLDKVSFRPSADVQSLADRIVKESSELRRGYGMVHVRRGDKGMPKCTSPVHVLERIQALAAVRGIELPASPSVWLVMSNGGQVWLSELQNRSLKLGINIVTETKLPLLATIEDNFMKYAVLQHLYGNAQRVLYTYKPMRLRPNKADRTFLAERLCGKFDEPNVPLAGGGRALKMNVSSC
jgi:hypothetical protein